MSGRDVVPLPLGGEVGQDRCVEPTQPLERVGPPEPVRHVLGRLLRRLRRSGHRRHRTPALVAAALLVPAALSGTVAAPSAKAADPVIFTVGLIGDVDSFNPFLGFEASSYEMWALTYDYMVGYSMKDMSPQPDLATKWDISDEGKTWTFDIRSGVK